MLGSMHSPDWINFPREVRAIIDTLASAFSFTEFDEYQGADKSAYTQLSWEFGNFLTETCPILDELRERFTPGQLGREFALASRGLDVMAFHYHLPALDAQVLYSAAQRLGTARFPVEVWDGEELYFGLE